MRDMILRIGFLMLSVGIVTAGTEVIAIPILLVLGGMGLMMMATKGEDIE